MQVLVLKVWLTWSCLISKLTWIYFLYIKNWNSNSRYHFINHLNLFINLVITFIFCNSSPSPSVKQKSLSTSSNDNDLTITSSDRFSRDDFTGGSTSSGFGSLPKKRPPLLGNVICYSSSVVLEGISLESRWETCYLISHYCKFLQSDWILTPRILYQIPMYLMMGVTTMQTMIRWREKKMTRLVTRGTRRAPVIWANYHILDRAVLEKVLLDMSGRSLFLMATFLFVRCYVSYAIESFLSLSYMFWVVCVWKLGKNLNLCFMFIRLFHRCFYGFHFFIRGYV